jgi:hypothetical protein
MRPTCCLAGIVALVALGSSKGAAQQERVPADLVITLERTACYGECPVYRVSIDASGKVTFQGTSFVRAKGLQTDTIPDSSVAALIATANRIGFFGLRESYRAPITDLSTTIVTITAGGRTKRVEDYFSAPGELKQFEHAIDEAARTQRWIRIDASTVRRFVREGRLVSPGEKAELLRHAVDQDDVDVVRELLRSGADPNAALFETHTTPLMFVRSASAALALLAAGARATARNTSGATPLGSAACAGNVPVVGVLLKAGADPSARGFAGRTPLECARQRRESLRNSPQPPNSWGKSLYAIDFDGVIAALEKALTGAAKP